MRKTNLYIYIFFICLFLMGLYSTNVYAVGDVLYLKNNIHAQEGSRDIKASYANYTDPGKGHIFIPVNSKIQIENWRKGFIIKTVDDNKTIYFEYHKDRMGMSVDEYISLITSPNPNPVSLEKYSKIDRKGIQEGKVYTGMSKDGVRAALGYPATHKTSSLEANTWIYWTNRFRTIAVEFDSNGKVEKIRS